MIKVTKYLYIHPLSLLLFVLCFITRQLELMALCYLIMFVHELAHLAAALFIGLMPSKIVIYPFGINLKLKNKIVYSLADEIILYMAGPLSNICMALLALPFLSKGYFWSVFYIQNISLFILNMLPVTPLDGGIIVKKIITYYLGWRSAEKVMRVISIIITALLAGLGVYWATVNHFNYSICFLVLFLMCNIFTAGEKYNVDFIRELMFYKEKGRCYNNQKVKTILMKEGEDLKRTAATFAAGCFYVIFCINQKGKITEILTETEIMERIMTDKN